MYVLFINFRQTYMDGLTVQQYVYIIDLLEWTETYQTCVGSGARQEVSTSHNSGTLRANQLMYR